MRVTIEDGVYSLVIEVKTGSMVDNGKERMIRYDTNDWYFLVRVAMRGEFGGDSKTSKFIRISRGGSREWREEERWAMEWKKIPESCCGRDVLVDLICEVLNDHLGSCFNSNDFCLPLAAIYRTPDCLSSQLLLVCYTEFTVYLHTNTANSYRDIIRPVVGLLTIIGPGSICLWSLSKSSHCDDITGCVEAQHWYKGDVNLFMGRIL